MGGPRPGESMAAERPHNPPCACSFLLPRDGRTGYNRLPGEPVQQAAAADPPVLQDGLWQGEVRRGEGRKTDEAWFSQGELQGLHQHSYGLTGSAFPQTGAQ